MVSIFIEHAANRTSSKGSYGEGPARPAYVLDVSALPDPPKVRDGRGSIHSAPSKGVLNDPALKSVVKTAVDKGCAVVAAKANEK
jgi:hypothetical protein